MIVHILACYTGFRQSEIGSVTMHSFNFESDPPTLTAEAGYSKRRRTDIALRKTFITNLSRAGVSPKTAQLLARHSDINLTMNTYTMLGVLDQAAAVEALPPIPLTTRSNSIRSQSTRAFA